MMRCFGGLMGLNEDMAPTLDRFLMKFQQLGWDFVDNEVMGFSKEFYD